MNNRLITWSQHIFNVLKPLIMPLSVIGLLCLPQTVLAGDPSTTDPLKAAATTIKSDFGPTSSFMTILYVVEVVVAVIAYVKTKNLLTLIGLPVVLIFTALASSAIAGS